MDGDTDMKVPYQTPLAQGRICINLDPEIVARILQMLSDGWKIVLNEGRVSADNPEVEITECLRDAMRDMARASKIKLSVLVLPGTESRSEPSMLAPDGRTDIPLMLLDSPLLIRQEHDPHVIIECKRITGADTSLCRLYVTEGMERFISRKYGWNHAQDFMVGYVLSGAPSDAVNRINAYLDGKSRRQDRLERSNIGATSTWQSQHTRPEPPNSIILHHTFLAFDGVHQT